MTHNIVLIRHGESLANIDLDVHLSLPDNEIPLSELGEKQAEGLDLKFSKEDTEKLKIYSSPYKRAFQTANLALGSEYSGRIVKEPLVAERRIRYKWGSEHYQNIIDNLRELGSFWWEGLDHGFENGFDVYQRANIFLNKISHKHFSTDEENCVLVFTHGFFMQMMRCVLIGDEGIDFNDQRKNPDNTESWLFKSEDGKNWELTGEIKNGNVEVRNNYIPV